MTKIAILVPCFNEAKRLNTHIFQDFAIANNNIDFYMVDDGSKDETGKVLTQIKQNNPTQFHIYTLSKNKGKAGALRDAIMNIKELNAYPYIGFIDADLPMPICEINALADALVRTPALLVTAGCRVNIVGHHIRRKPVRHYLSRIFVTYYDVFLKIPNYDTQCGIKLFETSFAYYLFEQPFVSKWIFDIELFVRAKKIWVQPLT